ncbi:hypothetical protein F2Q70_00037707 [Brassica cretica]|uniref:Replication protein A OB domain-containing protein n=1 Tax=Brassica cretica TaxID=69181 RepID=A0A8S9G7G7_BRACR|nr:hypothetical protein F2Q68_00033179 [Brassica cretica]KAF2586389.1 hypothetical protein F2Q70_00037707 [Brassica cretica]
MGVRAKFIAASTAKVSAKRGEFSDQRLTIVLWGDNAEVVSDVLHYSINYSINRALICVVRFGKISVCQSERSVSNVYNISDIALNPDMDEVEAFLKL